MRSFRIAYFADTHIGYSYADRNNERGVNLRVQDGYDALHEIVQGIVQEHESDPIDAILHGGDVFHTSHPSIRDIMTMQHYLRLIAKHKIPFYALAGNHDASDVRSNIAAVGVLNDPDRGLHALYEPYQTYDLNEQIVLHSVAHHGHKDERSPEVIPQADKINIFTTHGAAVDPKNATLMRCLDSPREQIIPPELVLSEDFAVRLLGHYHSRHPVGGESLNTWYSGSTLRRGFSDEAGDRGWLLVTVYEDESVEVEFRNIRQRPQKDFDVIDANGLTSQEIQDLIIDNLDSTNAEEKAENFNMRNAPILRQRVINADRHVREGIDRSLLARKAAHALRWQLEFMRPALQQRDAANSQEQDLIDKTVEEAAPTLDKKKSSGSINIEQQYLDWATTASQVMRNIPPESRSIVGEEGRRHLRSVAEKGE